MYRLIHFLEKLSRRSVMMLCVAFIAIVGLADYLSGPDIGVSLFYLVPIALATWFVGLAGGSIMSVISAATWFVAKWVVERGAFSPLATFWNALIRLGFFLVTVFMQHALKEEQARARKDALTGGSNRRHFLELARAEINRAQRYGHPVSIGYMDLDNFKEVNDQYGHDTGDQLLRLVMGTVQHNIRTTDTVARMGGDEFAFLLPETDAASVVNVMNKLHLQLLSAMQSRKWPVTFSIGVVTFQHPSKSIEEMLKTVDKLMYAAKQGGKNRINFATYD